MSLLFSVWTVFVCAIFFGVVVWAYSAARKSDFEQAARIPMDDEIRGSSRDGDS